MYAWNFAWCNGACGLFRIYIEYHHDRVLFVSGVVTTLAGSGTTDWADGVGTAASFYNPGGVSVDSNGAVYVADEFSNKIRKLTFPGPPTPQPTPQPTPMPSSQIGNIVSY